MMLPYIAYAPLMGALADNSVLCVPVRMAQNVSAIIGEEQIDETIRLLTAFFQKYTGRFSFHDLHGICRGGFSLFWQRLVLTSKGFRVSNMLGCDMLSIEGFFVQAISKNPLESRAGLEMRAQEAIEAGNICGFLSDVFPYPL